MLRLLGGATLGVWVFAFLTFFGTEVVLLEPQLRVVAQVLFAVPLVLWALIRVRRVPDLLDWAVIAALVLYVVVSLASRDRTGSFETLGLVSLYATLFWVSRDASANPALRDRMILGAGTAMAFTLAVNAFLLIREKVTFFAATGVIPQLEGLEVFPWETVNAMPILVLLALPAVAWMRPGLYRRIALSVVILSALFVVPFSNGRAGYLGLLVAAIAFVLLSPQPWAWLSSRTVLQRRAVLGGAAVVVLVALVIGAAPFIQAMASSGRGDLYAASVQMFADRPVLGHGPSTYSWARLLYGGEPARLLAVRLTHDVPLQTLVDGGIVLAVALVAIIAAWLRLALAPNLNLPRRSTVAVLIGFGIAVLFDDFSFLPAVTALIICLAAFALPVSVRRNGPMRWLPLLAAGGCLLLALPFALQADTARLSAAAARQAAVAGDWARAEAAFASATEAHAENGGYWLGLAKARAELGNDDGAHDAYRSAAKASPGDARAYGGQAAYAQGPERIALLQEAERWSIGDPQYAYRLGIELAERGDSAAAAEAWGRAVYLRSALIGVLPYDQYGVDRAAVAEAAIAHTESATRPDVNIDPDTRWDVQLAMDELPSTAGLPWLAVDAARRGAAAVARELAEDAIDADPRTARSYAAKYAVAVFGCDAKTALPTLKLESAMRDAPGEPAPDVAIRREFVYREASLGAMQPPSVAKLPATEGWPWSLVQAPPCRDSL